MNDNRHFNEILFHSKLSAGIDEVKKLLGSERTPHLPDDCPHRWADKFDLAGFILKATAASLLESLKKL